MEDNKEEIMSDQNETENEINQRLGQRDKNYSKAGDPIRDMVTSVLGFSFGSRIICYEPNIIDRTVTVTFEDKTKAIYDCNGKNVI